MIINEVSSTLSLAKTPATGLKPDEKRSTQEKDIIKVAHQYFKIPHDLVWEPSSKGFTTFSEENLRTMFVAYNPKYRENTDVYLVALAFLLRGPKGSIFLIAKPYKSGGRIKGFDFDGVWEVENEINTFKDLKKSYLLPTVKTSTGKIAFNAGEILIAPILSSHYKRISNRQEKSTEKNYEMTDLYKKIYPLFPKFLKQTEADIIGFVQTMIKNRAIENANEKLTVLKRIRDLEDTLERTGTINNYLAKSMEYALTFTAAYMYPELTGTLSKSYTDIQPENYTGRIKVLQEIQNNNTKVLSTYLAFLKRSLLLVK